MKAILNNILVSFPTNLKPEKPGKLLTPPPRSFCMNRGFIGGRSGETPYLSPKVWTETLIYSSFQVVPGRYLFQVT